MTDKNKSYTCTFAVGQSHTAVGRKDGSFEIYDDQGDLSCTLPAGTPDALIPQLVAVIGSATKHAFESGRNAGIHQFQSQMRGLIGAAESK
jgi:hypothetical protein